MDGNGKAARDAYVFTTGSALGDLGIGLAVSIMCLLLYLFVGY
jgi:hypothetical protein